MLSVLTLYVMGTEYLHDGFPQLAGIEKVKDHQGRLTLKVGIDYVDAVLKLLSEGFLWPGLEHVEIEIKDHSVGALISIIAARQAGARGASKEQYLQTFRDASARLFDDQPRRMTRALKDACAREAQRIMAAASAFQLHAGTSPLCSEVQWKIHAPDSISEDLLNWLQEQPNIDVERL